MSMRLSRRRFVLGAGGLALGALAGCGAPGSTPRITGAPANGAAPYPRTIQDKFGAVEIKAKPQRIMALYANANLDALLALGVKPTLIAAHDGSKLLPWQSAAQDVPFLVMAESRPNIEKVLAEGIDLIVAGAYSEATSESNDGSAPNPIADIPIVTIDNGDPVAQLRIVGDALGLEAQAAAKADEIATLFADFEAPYIPASIKAFGTRGDGTFEMYKSSSALGLLLERFGMPLLECPTDIGNQQINTAMVYNIPNQQIGELESDVLLGISYDKAAFDTIVDAPLFKQLQVVKNGHFEAFSNDESLAIVHNSVLTIPTAKELLLRALSS